MSSLGRNTGSDNNVNNKDTIENLQQQLDDCTALIRQILNGRKDVKDISTEDKQKLSTQYLRASQLASKLSQRHTNSTEVEKFKDLANKFSERAKMYGANIKSKIPSTTFDDVKGLDDVKKIVKSFTFIAQNPEITKYYKIDGGMGLLMYGAPGTGKTMFAEAIANALRLPLFVITPADIFKSYVGASEQAVRQLFDEIEACPDGAILFVDECESIFSRRTEDTKDYKAAVTTELLQRINGFGVDGSKRMMIAATNRPEIIDPAYLRFKRFSHLVHIAPPDLEAKRAIIESKLSGIELADITIQEILMMTERTKEVQGPLGPIQVSDGRYSAADICGIVEEACRLAMEKIQEQGSTTPIPLTREMFEKAFNKIRPSISEETLKEYENFRAGS